MLKRRVIANEETLRTILLHQGYVNCNGWHDSPYFGFSFADEMWELLGQDVALSCIKHAGVHLYEAIDINNTEWYFLPEWTETYED